MPSVTQPPIGSFLLFCFVGCATNLNLWCTANSIEGWTYDRGTTANCDGSTVTGLCGPEYWGNLDGAESCGSDTHQSPMNLAQAVITNKLPNIHFDYNSGCAYWTQGANDHNFNIKFAPDCYNLTMTIDDEKYYLDSLHLHSPSEHTIGGGSFAAEAHLLHYSFSTDKIVYVSILLDESSDRLPFTNNSFLDGLWNLQTVSDIASESEVRHSRAINPYEDLFPGTYSHFNYVGSLTTPPCTPGANWFIFDTPVPISADDVRIIRASMETVPDSKRSQQGNTNRPVQPKNNRPLYYSFGLNSNSEFFVEESTCDSKDTKLAKLLSIIAIGISTMTLLLLCFISSKHTGMLAKRDDGGEKSEVADESNKLANKHIVDIDDASTSPTVNSNPLQDPTRHDDSSKFQIIP